MIQILTQSVDELRNYLLEKRCFISSSGRLVFDSETENSINEYIVSGKLIRGGLLVHLLDKNNSNDALILGSALELAQSALIIQDDIMDHDDVRRGKPSLHILLSKSLYSDSAGVNRALCVVDYLLFQSQGLLSSIENTSAIPSLSRYWSKQLKRVSIGQYYDIQYSSTPTIPSVKEIRRLYENKTSSYTFCIPFVSSALYLNLPVEMITFLEKIGNELGILFQLTDDMLNVYGESKKSGKPTGSDIREKKKTLLVSLVYETLDRGEQKILYDYYVNITSEKISSVITLMNSVTVKQKIEHEVQSLKDSIEQSLTDPSVSAEIKITVKSLLDFIVTRTV